MSFEIHPQLLADCHQLLELPNSHVLLHKNAVIPWMIQVPKTDITDLLELPTTLRNAILYEAALIAQAIKKHWGLTKMNVAQLGNQVPQMHLHIIGRRQNDDCWPQPVWGNLTEEKTYTVQELDAITASILQQM